MLNRLQLRGDETIIDAGCGSGRLTRLLLERVPRGRVIGVDVSPQMAETARANLERDFNGRIEVLCRDLLALDLDRVADVVFSTATFHWIPDQLGLFRGIARALKPGGRLLGQMGGEGNLRRLLGRAEALEKDPAYWQYFDGWTRPNVYPNKDETLVRLLAAGFDQIEFEHFPEPTTFRDRQSFAEFISTIVFRLNLQRITDAGRRQAFIDRLVELAAKDDPAYTLDYWRLNLNGIRA
ncbi:MAG TPA: methyltransferase domain-containing protein [Candidatus Dormibacteraeota bacterium]|nr:methyltransferase domain-containing protein [Candidatus Dormibacteraeota bacterium]